MFVCFPVLIWPTALQADDILWQQIVELPWIMIPILVSGCAHSRTVSSMGSFESLSEDVFICPSLFKIQACRERVYFRMVTIKHTYRSILYFTHHIVVEPCCGEHYGLLIHWLIPSPQWSMNVYVHKVKGYCVKHLYNEVLGLELTHDVFLTSITFYRSEYHFWLQHHKAQSQTGTHPSRCVISCYCGSSIPEDRNNYDSPVKVKNYSLRSMREYEDDGYIKQNTYKSHYGDY